MSEWTTCTTIWWCSPQILSTEVCTSSCLLRLKHKQQTQYSGHTVVASTCGRHAVRQVSSLFYILPTSYNDEKHFNQFCCWINMMTSKYHTKISDGLPFAIFALYFWMTMYRDTRADYLFRRRRVFDARLSQRWHWLNTLLQVSLDEQYSVCQNIAQCGAQYMMTQVLSIQLPRYCRVILPHWSLQWGWWSVVELRLSPHLTSAPCLIIGSFWVSDKSGPAIMTE